MKKNIAAATMPACNTSLQGFRSCYQVWKRQNDKKVLYFQNLDLNQDNNVNRRLQMAGG